MTTHQGERLYQKHQKFQMPPVGPTATVQRHPLLAAVVVLACSIVIAATATAQDDEDAPDEDAARVERTFSDIDFDSWVFRHGQAAADVQLQLDKALDLAIDDVNRTARLTDAQRAKLQLAGRGDIRRYFDQVEALRRKVVSLRRDSGAVNDVWRQIQPLQTQLAIGLFGDRSLFRKSLRRVLEAEQAAGYEQNERDRRRFQYRAKLEWVVAMLDNVMMLRDDQRQAFVQLLLKETRLPLVFSESDHYVVMWQMSRLPEDKLKPLFDDEQWKILNTQFSQMRSIGRYLKQNGRLALEGDPTAGDDETPDPKDSKK
jgi:hypothetical protein